MKLDDSTHQVIYAALAGKRGKEKKAVVQDLAATLQVSEGYLYRLCKYALPTGRTRRKDADSSRTRIDHQVQEFMLSLTSRADLSSDMVLFMAARQFGLPEHFISRTTYNRWLQHQRMGRRDIRRDLRPARRFEAERANDLHHFDTTVAEAFYENADGSVGYEPAAKRNKNKPGNKRPRIVLYSLVDDFSRVTFARFYLSDNTLNLLDFVQRAWTQKGDARFPFYGLPTEVYCDLGPSNVSTLFENALQKLGVKRLETTPSNAQRFGSRKHGKVERTFGEGILGEFMKLTKIVKFASLEEMNETFWDWLIHLNNRPFKAGEGRFSRWLGSVRIPRQAPSESLWWQLTHRRRRATVDRYLCIRINGKQFQLPQRTPYLNWVEAKIEVYWHPNNLEKIFVVHDYHEEELDALAPVVDIAGDYKSIATTAQEHRLDALNDVDLSRINVADMWKTDLPYVPRRGQAFDDSQIATKTVTTETGETRPSFAPSLWHSRIRVALELTPYFESHDERNRFVAEVMGDREKIEEDELQAIKAQLRRAA